MKKSLPCLLIYLVFAIQMAWCAVITPSNMPFALPSTAIPQAADWNNSIVGAVTYLNNSVVPLFNVLTTKGDTYVYNGSSGLLAISATDNGSHDKILTASAAQSAGMLYQTPATLLPINTKGDLEAFSGTTSTIVKVPVGVNTSVLMVDSTKPVGMTWSAVGLGKFPTGAIVAWSPAGAGTTTIPSGMLVCNGLNGTPNLIGKFICGTRPNGSSATPAAGGYGAQTVDTVGAGSKQHTHSFSFSFTTGGSSVQIVSPAALPDSFGPVNPPWHTHPASGGITTALATSEPSDWALIYLQQQ